MASPTAWDRTVDWLDGLASKMYTYNPKTAGKQIAASVSYGQAPQLQPKATVIPAKSVANNKEVVRKAIPITSQVQLPVLNTIDDVKAMQTRLGVKADGIIGPKTEAAMQIAGMDTGGTKIATPTKKQNGAKKEVVPTKSIDVEALYGSTKPVDAAYYQQKAEEYANNRIQNGGDFGEAMQAANAGGTNSWSGNEEYYEDAAPVSNNDGLARYQAAMAATKELGWRPAGSPETGPVNQFDNEVARLQEQARLTKEAQDAGIVAKPKEATPMTREEVDRILYGRGSDQWY